MTEASTSAGDFEDFKSAVLSQVMDAVKSSSSKAMSFSLWNEIQAFSHAVHWQEERWIQVILSTHFLLYVSTIVLFRTNLWWQAIVFCLIVIVVMLLETLNQIGADHWKEFAHQNYFDKHGVFMSIVVAAPLMMLAFSQLLNLLWITSSLLIKVKRMEVRKQKKEQLTQAQTQTQTQEKSEPVLVVEEKLSGSQKKTQ